MRHAHSIWKLTTLAAAMAAAHAAAQDGTTQIYGTFNVDVESVSARGSVPARTRVTQNSSNIGFRGTERINPDALVFWQVESGVPVDAGNGTFASRNSAVGFKSKWGTLFLGQWDTPYKSISGAVDPMYFTGITYSGAIIGTPGFNVGPVTIAAPATSSDGRTFRNVANASFERRQGNSIQYWTPDFHGAVLKAAYSVDEAKAQSPSATQVDPYILSASAEWQSGIFYAAYAYELHADYFGLDALAPAAEATLVAGDPNRPSARDIGHKLIARVKFGGTQLGVIAERLRYGKSAEHAVTPGALSRYQRDAYAIALLQKVGAAGTIRALVGKARDGRCEHFDASPCDSHGLGARQFSIGYSYTLSRRTDVYAFHTRVDNEERGSYPFANGAGLGAAPGAENIGYVLGIRHTF